MHSPASEQKERVRKKSWRNWQIKCLQINENQQHLLTIGNDVPALRCLELCVCCCAWRCETHVNGREDGKAGGPALRKEEIYL